METALGAANWLLGKVLQKLSHDLVAAYVASSELGLNFEQIKTQLNYTHGLLHAAQERDVSNNPGLQGLLEDLSKKADEAEDALDELHYFIIQDQLDCTHEAAPEVGGGLRGRALHGRHATGNWFSGLFFWRTKHDDTDVAVDNNPRNAKRAKFDNDNGGHVDKLPFDRVAMSNKIKSVIEGIHSLCAPVSDLLKINHTAGRSASLKRPPTSSVITQDKLYGRDAIFYQTVKAITSGTYHGATLSVLPIVGPGGIGKTTFAQHLYNDKRTEAYFSVRVWVCVSTGFDVLRLTQEILKCIPATENEERIMANDTTNLNQLQMSIAQKLKSKRFLIVLDDIWKCCSESKWENLLAPFTKGEAKGDMVLVTTRFPKVAEMVMKAPNTINLQGLEPNDFFTFFEACVFGENKPEHYEDDLTNIGRQIAKKLKCSPLAAKTVGRLLKNNLSQEHWVEVLEKKEWQNQSNDDDIMPALKISYEYLPFHLKKCFSYCALFPEDHRFDSLEITRFWIALGIIDSSGKNNKIEDIGLKYLDELVDNGFLMKVGDGWSHYYVMHDLLHELAQNVSSRECANISCSSFRADDIPPFVHHLSITIQDKYDENFEEEMFKLKRMIDVGNLRTLMIFGEYNSANISNIIKDTFNGIKGLRVLFIFMYSLESLPHNFSKLIHLRYLKIGSPLGLEQFLPSIISRFYHLKFLDLEQWHGSYDLPKDISRLVNLRHFIARNQIHSNVPEVGKMKYLQELKEFHVKKESVGFELRELGKLTELGGELTICNLENVRTWEEASEAKLVKKKDLDKLVLVWSRGKPTIGADVLDGLKPHSNIRALEILNHAGAAAPSWFCGDICIKQLESLHLDGVSWDTLPPFGLLPRLKELKLKNIAGMRQFGPDFGDGTDRSFIHLKEVVFDNMPELVEWVRGDNFHLFSRLEIIKCTDCPKLSALPFSQCSGHSTQEKDTICFPNLCDLSIYRCPKLSLPPMPHTSTLTKIWVAEQRVLKLHYAGNLNELRYHGYNCALAFHNLDKVEKMKLENFSNLKAMSLLSNLTSLTHLELLNCDNLTIDGFDPSITFNLKKLVAYNYIWDGNRPCSIAADLLMELATTKVMPAGSFQLEELEVDTVSAVLVAPICNHLSATLRKLCFQCNDKTESFTEEQEHALQLLTSLQALQFGYCVSLHSLQVTSPFYSREIRHL